MDHYNDVASFYAEYMEQLSLSVDSIADSAGRIAEIATATLFDDKRLFCIGVDIDAAAAISLIEQLRSGIYRERPVLPVIELTSRTAETRESGIQWCLQQLRALGHPGDAAIIFYSDSHSNDIDAFSATLAQRGVQAAWVGCPGPGLSLSFPGANLATRLALSQASAMSIAYLIDTLAFGPVDSAT